MHHARRLHPRITIAMATALLALSGPARADDDQYVEEPRKKLTGEILIGEADTEATQQQSWLRENIHTVKRHGFEFRRSFSTRSGKKLIFNIHGPLVKKKTPGLSFEIRF